MEPDEMRMYSSSPPPLEDDETGHEEDDEFGDFGSFSGRLSSSLSFTEFTDPHTGLSQPCSMTSPLEHFTRSNRIFRPGNVVHDGNSKRPAEQFQPSSYVTTKVDSSQKEFNRQDCISELPVPLTNGFLERVHQETLPDHHATTTPALCNCPQREETGFADFSAFAEPEMQPWCCGFTHTDPTEHSEGREKGTNLTNGFSEDHSDTEQETVMESEPGSKYLAEEGNIDCTRVVQHCEQRDSEPTHQSQDLSLDLSVLTTPTEEHDPGSEEPVGPAKRVPSPNKQVNLIQAPELEGEGERDWEGTEREEEEEETISPLPTTVSGSVSEEFASFCEAVSPDGLEDFGDFSETVFALSSMAPQEDVTGDLREKTETKIEEEEEQEKQEMQEKEKEEDFGNFRNAGSFPSQDFTDLEQSESKVQGEDGFADFEQACRVREGGQGDLPTSDSFADFRSAHLDDDAKGQGEKEEAWGAFGDQRTPSERETWAEFGEEKSAKWTGPEEEEKEEGEVGGWQGSAAERRDSFQASLSCRLQRLLLASFPAVAVAEVTEEDIMSLGALLEAQDTQPEEGEGERQKQREGEQPSHVAHWVPHCIWQQPQDLHNAFCLKFQWGGSHSNMTLLHCLGMDTRNILFTGQRKHPVIVPVFAADLGMLEPTKEPLMSASTAGQTAATAQALSGSQGGLPSVQFDWSSCGLSNPLDASSVSSYSSGLNLDYFGPVEDCGSNSSSSPSTPPPGVDPELYELTTAKLETSDTSGRLADTYNRLMATMEKTSTTTRKPHGDKELSGEAAKVMSGLPDLSFMLVKVLMFRSTLAPPDTCSMALE